MIDKYAREWTPAEIITLIIVGIIILALIGKYTE